MMNDGSGGNTQRLLLIATDAYVVNAIEMAIKFRQARFERMVQCADHGLVNKLRKSDTGRIVDVNQISISDSLMQRPCGVSGIAHVVVNVSLDGPLRLLKEPSFIHIYCGLTVGIHDDINTFGFKTLSELSDEQLCAAILFRWNGDKWWCYQCNLQRGSEIGHAT